MMSVRNTPDVLPLEAPPIARYRPVICREQTREQTRCQHFQDATRNGGRPLLYKSTVEMTSIDKIEDPEQMISGGALEYS